MPQSHVSCIILWLKLTVGWTLCIKTIGFWDIMWLARKLTSRFCASYIGLIHPAWPPNRICTHLLFCFRASLLMPLTTIVHLGAFRVSLDASKSTCFLWCELMRPEGSYRSRRCMTSMASFPRSLTLSFFLFCFTFFFATSCSVHPNVASWRLPSCLQIPSVSHLLNEKKCLENLLS